MSSTRSRRRNRPRTAAKPVATPSEFAADSRQAQENLLWESAQHSNLPADYQAYLSAFPSGVFAQMAKNRIASMESARTSAPRLRRKPSPWWSRAGPKDDAIKDNIGTADTERALNLGAAGEKEVQQRLSALDLYTGPKTGALDAATRSALAQWQKKSGFAPTSFLDSAQLAALKADSETEYQKSLAAQPAIQPAAPEAPPRFGQTFAEGPGDASGETFGASDARSTRGQANEPKSARDRGAGCASASAARLSRRESRLAAESGIA